MDEEMEDAEPRRMGKKKEKVVDPSGPHEIGLLWKYHVHVARKAADGEIFINVKLTLNLKLPVYILLNLFVKP
jgi:hypothetical protein